MSDSSKVFGLPTAHVALLFCLFELIFCIYALPYASANPIMFGGVLFAPVVQWVIGTFLCVVIVTTILAGIGVYYGIASHITLYLGVLCAYAFLDFVTFLVFLGYGSGCRTYHVAGTASAATYSCGLWNGASLFSSLMMVVFQLAGIFIFLRAQQEAHREYSRTLVPYLKGVEKAASLNPRPAQQQSYGAGGSSATGAGATIPPTSPPVAAAGGGSLRASIPAGSVTGMPSNNAVGSFKSAPAASFKSAPAASFSGQPSNAVGSFKSAPAVSAAGSSRSLSATQLPPTRTMPAASMGNLSPVPSSGMGVSPMPSISSTAGASCSNAAPRSFQSQSAPAGALPCSGASMGPPVGSQRSVASMR
mmetsp:Transcript_34710/g.81031  ORF Transcript_34710/g.81031 Transcript_34710/m.81031 type:complete len:362 (+) Transcript_34710:141-1226(+)